MKYIKILQVMSRAWLILKGVGRTIYIIPINNFLIIVYRYKYISKV